MTSMAAGSTQSSRPFCVCGDAHSSATFPAMLLSVTDLRIAFPDARGDVTEVVAGVSFTLPAGRTLGIVGESGSGKSVSALSIMRLLPTGRVSGRITFDGVDLLAVSDAQMRDLRGNRLAMIFQEPMTSLNPSWTVGDQIGETLVRHRGLSRREAAAAAVELLRQVRIPSPEQRANDHPHKLSGGMRQRVMIAMALACRPALLIADEPTTALDVTIQAQVLDLLRDLRDATGTAILLITHDLGVVADMCDDAVVMYAGEVVERAPVEQLFADPQHPYTVGLMGSVPRFGAATARLAAIPGMVPPPDRLPTGCRFAPRCPFADETCRATRPPLRQINDRRATRCLKAPLDSLVAV
jgi:peptide/nickel transport system ATP-binding protein